MFECDCGWAEARSESRHAAFEAAFTKQLECGGVLVYITEESDSNPHGVVSPSGDDDWDSVVVVDVEGARGDDEVADEVYAAVRTKPDEEVAVMLAFYAGCAIVDRYLTEFKV
jgi:hypothetical protein